MARKSPYDYEPKTPHEIGDDWLNTDPVKLNMTDGSRDAINEDPDPMRHLDDQCQPDPSGHMVASSLTPSYVASSAADAALSHAACRTGSGIRSWASKTFAFTLRPAVGAHKQNVVTGA